MVEEWVSLCTSGNFSTSMCLSMVPCCRGASSKSEPRKFKLEEALRIPLVLALIFADKGVGPRERKYMCPEEVGKVGESGES